MVVLAGPGSLGAVAGIRVLAGITGATVVNTVGAKGLLAWDDPLHGGTVGLQTGDADLAELTTADLVVTTGLDRRESASLGVALAGRRGETVDVDPAHLALAAGGWPPADGPGARPPFYDAVAAVAGPLYQQPGSPPAAAAALAAGLVPGGFVVAPPGPAGFWIGRTFPTSAPGSVVVPTGQPAGTAESVALAAARTGRVTTLVVPASDSGRAEAVAAVASTEGLPLVVEVWAGSGELVPDGPARRSVPVDWSVLDRLVAVAGPPDPAIWPGAPA